jgi:transcriptional regulator of arginine metabolism
VDPWRAEFVVGDGHRLPSLVPSDRAVAMRATRRKELFRILHEGHATSQDEIVSALRAAGHHVAQATVSRDLQELGAMKVKVGSEFVYRLRDEIPKSANADLVARDLSRTLSDFALDIRTSGPLVVLLTAPGHAGAVARAIDLAGPEEIVGTIAGDDTIFVATPDTRTAARVAGRWSGTDNQPPGEPS